MSRTVLHVDINSYFATLLQQENPRLRGRPIGVVKDEGRTCVIAASKEAKQFGVYTGCRADEARQLCPQIIFLPAAFDRYLDATKRLKKVFTNLSPHVYIYSLDEAFVDVSDCQKYLYPDLNQLARLIQARIKQELGEWVTCNVGISHNRFLAKLASETAPKGSYLIIDDKNLDPILASVEFNDVCGIGLRLAKKLKRFGITHPYQIRFYAEADLQPSFGPFWTKELIKMAWGQEPHHLDLLDRHQPHMKSVGRSITGYHLYDDERQIRSIIHNLIEEVTYKVRQMNLAGRQASISLVGQRQSWWSHLTVQRSIRHTEEMFDILYHQLYQHWQRRFRIIRFAVRLSLLQPFGQASLLPNWSKQEKIYRAMDQISHKYGLFTLRSGSLLNQPIIRPEVTGFLGDKIYHQL